MESMADYYADMSYAAEAEFEYRDEHYKDIHHKDLLVEYLKGSLVWKDTIIQNMDDSYLINTINWIDKKRNKSKVLRAFKNILLIEKYNRKL
jgi:hypothetical protein